MRAPTETQPVRSEGAPVNQTIRLAVVALCYALSISIRMEAAEFIPLGDFPEGVFRSAANAVSSDGITVVGAGSRYPAFLSTSDAMRWDESSGIVNLQSLPLGSSPRSRATGVSGTGEVVVGVIDYQSGSPSSQPFRWTAAEGLVGLGLLSNEGDFQYGVAADVSADGQVIIGESSSNNGISEAFRWTQAAGMIGLGDLPGGDFSSAATGISDDGNVIAGVGHSASGSEAFRWTSDMGMVGLGDLPGGFYGSGANAISSDGKAVVGSGRSELSGSSIEAFRWTEEQGMQPLGDLPGGSFTSEAFGVSSNGAVVLGTSDRDDGFKAFVWDELHGMRDLQEILISEYGLGAELTGWTLTIASDISADGLSVVGSGINPDGNGEAYLVRLDRPLTAPEPSSLALLLGGAILAALRHHRR